MNGYVKKDSIINHLSCNGMCDDCGFVRIEGNEYMCTLDECISLIPEVLPLSELWKQMKSIMSSIVNRSDYGTVKTSLNGAGQLLSGVAADLSTLTSAAVSSPATAQNSTVNNNSTRSIVQNVTFNNSYSGGTIDAQRSIAKGMSKSAEDATTYMARGLEYARG